MKVSLVKETRFREKRVLLLPEQISRLSEVSSTLVEENAGKEMGINNGEYERAGAKIVDKQTAWGEADLVLKLKCPLPEEISLLQDEGSIAALFHAEVAPELVDSLIDKNITAYSFEYFRNEEGGFPLMKATGEISGKQAIIYAAYHLQSHIGGSGKLLPSSSTVSGAKIAILGLGNVGKSAAEMAIALEANIVIFRWGEIAETEVELSGKKITCFPWDRELIREIIPTCDVVIGAIRISTFDTPVFLGSEVIQKMVPGSVIVDVTAGYGIGYIESSNKLTTLDNPYYVTEGVKHIKIRELPLGVHQTAAQQISSIYGSHIYNMVISIDGGKNYPTAENGIITRGGKIVNSQVSKHYELRFKG